MGMTINDARDNKPACKLSFLCGRTDELCDASLATDVDKSAILNCNRFSPRLLIVGREYLGAGENQICTFFRIDAGSHLAGSCQ
jgi:hypothetical protein